MALKKAGSSGSLRTWIINPIQFHLAFILLCRHIRVLLARRQFRELGASDFKIATIIVTARATVKNTTTAGTHCHCEFAQVESAGENPRALSIDAPGSPVTCQRSGHGVPLTSCTSQHHAACAS